MQFISNCSFFDDRSVAIPGELVHCSLKSVKHYKTAVVLRRQYFKKEMCFKNVLRLVCDEQFFCRQLSEQKFFVSVLQCYKVPKNLFKSCSAHKHSM